MVYTNQELGVWFSGRVSEVSGEKEVEFDLPLLVGFIRLIIFSRVV